MTENNEKVVKTVELELDKECKNAMRFKEKGNDVETIGTIYVQKHVLKEMGDVHAKKVRVTVELA